MKRRIIWSSAVAFVLIALVFRLSIWDALQSELPEESVENAVISFDDIGVYHDIDYIDDIDLSERLVTLTAEILSFTAVPPIDISLLYSENELPAGATVWYISRVLPWRDSLPAWLSLGLELVWISQYGSDAQALTIDESFDLHSWIEDTYQQGLPPFSDMWFLEEFSNTDMFQGFMWAAYKFVSYLMYNDYLDGLIRLYTSIIHDVRVWESDMYFAQKWARFTMPCGGNLSASPNANSHGHGFVLHYNHNLSEESTANLFTIYTLSGVYEFDDGGWSIDRALEYVHIMGEAILWVKDFMGYNFYTPIVGELRFAQQGPVSGFARPGWFRVYNSSTFFSRIAVHEVVHAVMLKMGESSSLFSGANRRFFTEGHADVMQVLFAKQNTEFGHMFEMSLREFIETMERLTAHNISDNQPDIISFISIYENISELSFDNDPLDFAAIFHTAAIMQIKYAPAWFPFQAIAYAYQANKQFPFMYSYFTNASFIFHLLSIGSHDNLREVYADYDLFEQVYGKSLEGLLEDWFIYLGLDWPWVNPAPQSIGHPLPSLPMM